MSRSATAPTAYPITQEVRVKAPAMRPPSSGGTGTRLKRFSSTAAWPRATSRGCGHARPAPSTSHAASEPVTGPAIATRASTPASRG